MTLDNRHLSQSDERFEEDDDVISDEVIEQLREVRESGAVNMMDVAGVFDYCLLVDDYGELQAFITHLEQLTRSERAERWMATLKRL